MPSRTSSIVFLVDTNIISELTRIQPNPGVVAWAKTISNISLSAVTVEEICFGLSWKPNPRIQSWFDGFLRRHCTICAVTNEIAQCSGRLRGSLAAQGHTRTQADRLIAATAQGPSTDACNA
ncbi:MAG: PIN domain-containing protein [Gammaproteobacteria bacterium]